MNPQFFVANFANQCDDEFGYWLVGMQRDANALFGLSAYSGCSLLPAEYLKRSQCLAAKMIETIPNGRRFNPDWTLHRFQMDEASVQSIDFKGLRRLREIVGAQFVTGIVLYDGTHALPFGEGLWAEPLARL